MQGYGVKCLRLFPQHHFGLLTTSDGQLVIEKVERRQEGWQTSAFFSLGVCVASVVSATFIFIYWSSSDKWVGKWLDVLMRRFFWEKLEIGGSQRFGDNLLGHGVQRSQASRVGGFEVTDHKPITSDGVGE